MTTQVLPESNTPPASDPIATKEEETEGEEEPKIEYRSRPRPMSPEEIEFHRHIQHENYAKVLSMVELKEDLCFAINPISWFTSLHIACFYNRGIEIAETLLEHGADIHAPDIIGLTPIQRATIVGNIDMTQFLLNQISGPEKIKIVKSLHLLQIATRGNQARMVRFLLSLGIDINGVDKYGYSALHYAAEKEYVEIILLLLSFDAQVDILNFQNRAALQLPKDINIKKLFILPKHHPLVKDMIIEKNLELETLNSMLDGFEGDEEKIGLLDELEKIKEKLKKITNEFNLLKGLSLSISNGTNISNYWKKQFDGQMFYRETQEMIVQGKEEQAAKQRVDMEGIQERINAVRTHLDEQEGLMEEECNKEIENVKNEVSAKLIELKNEISSIQKSNSMKYENELSLIEKEIDKNERDREMFNEEIKLLSSSKNENNEIANLEIKNSELEKKISEGKKNMEKIKSLNLKFEALKLKDAEKQKELQNWKDSYEDEITAIEEVYVEERNMLEEKLAELEIEFEELSGGQLNTPLPNSNSDNKFKVEDIEVEPEVDDLDDEEIIDEDPS